MTDRITAAIAQDYNDLALDHEMDAARACIVTRLRTIADEIEAGDRWPWGPLVNDAGSLEGI